MTPQYSLLRVIRELSVPDRDTRQIGGLEQEVSDELANRFGRQPTGAFVPLSALASPRELRALNTTAGLGSVPTILDAGPIDVLRARAVVGLLGAQFVTAMGPGMHALPAKGATVSLGWVGEGSAVSPTNPTITQQVPFTPRTCGCYVDITRKALSSIPGAEAIVRDDIARALANEVDRVAIAGSGGLNQEPLGLLARAIPEIAFGANGAAPTWPLVCSLEETVAVANGDTGALGFLTTPQGRNVLRQTYINGGSIPVWHRGQVLDVPALATNNLPSNFTKGSGTNLSAAVYGAWDELMIMQWGAVDLVVNPYLLSLSGVVRVSAFLDVDVAIPRIARFAAALDMVAA